MTRKYYKDNISIDAVEVSIVYVCPNTNKTCAYTPKTYEFSGYADRMGYTVSVYLECESCSKHHTVYLRDD